MLRGVGTTGRAGWLAALAGALTWSCTHHEPRPAARSAAPGGDVAALQPCPPELVTKSVREVLAQKWPADTCFAVRGRLTATWGSPPYLRVHRLSAGRSAGARDPDVAAADPPLDPQALGWVLTDLADPFTPRRDDDHKDAQPTIMLNAVWHYQPWLLPLLRCNRDDDGNRIMPAATQFELPDYGLTAVERLNAGLAGLTVVVFGGKQARDFVPDRLWMFDNMYITHVCRLDAPVDAGAQDGD